MHAVKEVALRHIIAALTHENAELRARLINEATQEQSSIASPIIQGAIVAIAVPAAMLLLLKGSGTTIESVVRSVPYVSAALDFNIKGWSAQYALSGAWYATSAFVPGARTVQEMLKVPMTASYFLGAGALTYVSIKYGMQSVEDVRRLLQKS